MVKRVYLCRYTHPAPLELKERLVCCTIEQEYDIRVKNPVFFFGERGKPYLQDGLPFFNLSDSGGWLACVADTDEIGLDIQQVRRVSDRVMRRYLRAYPSEPLMQTMEWTTFESFVKMTGTGIVVGRRIDYTQGSFLHSFALQDHVITVCFSGDRKYSDLELRFPDL